MTNSNSVRGLKKKSIRLIKNNKLIEARKILQPLCQSVPKDISAWNLLADVCYQLNQMNDAEYCYNQILTLDKNYPAASQRLGMINHRKRNYTNALNLYRHALQNDYKKGETYYLIGTVYRECGEIGHAQSYYEKSLEIDPNDFKTLNNLSEIYSSHGRVSDAIKLLEKANSVQPGHEFVINNLSKSNLTQGKAEKASSLLRNILNNNSSNPDMISNYLLSINYLANKSPKFIFNEHLHWGKILQAAQKINSTNINRKIDTNKPIRIGIISADLKDHPVTRFIYSFFKYHHSDLFQIHCYSNSIKSDSTSDNLKKMINGWHEVYTLQDQQLADLIAEDNIDILLDLSGHTSDNRTPLLASNVAPLQLTYVGYPNTTGLTTIDYRIVDNFTDPLNVADKIHTEKLLRIDGCFLSYTPDYPDIIAKKITEKSNTVFGSFNNMAKTTPEVIKTWCKILKRVPNSKLLLKNQTSSDNGTREYIHDICQKHDIDHGRIEFLNSVADKSEHLLCYNKIDIGLDTFPYNGTTTTMEALWMNTPVIALCGNSHVSRVGYSILKNLNHTELIAHSIDEYIELAVSLAGNNIRLKQLHNTIRDTLKTSCIMDYQAHTNKMEVLFTDIIKKYNDSL